MTNLEQHVREAFDSVTLPQEVRSRVLASLDEYEKTLTAQKAAEEAKETVLAPVRPRPRVTVWRRAALAVAACLLVMVMGFAGSKLYFDETAFVDIDINPSITLGLNRFDIVVSAKPLNEDAEILLGKVSLTGKSYDEAMRTLTASTAFASYSNNAAFMEISVTSQNEQQSTKLCEQSNAHLSNLPSKGACHEVDAETREKATAAGMGTGRYQAALRLMEYDKSLTLEQCASMSMRELYDQIAAYTDANTSSEGTDSDPGRASAQGHGHQGQENGTGHGRGAQHKRGQ